LEKVLYSSPVGTIEIAASEKGITSLLFREESPAGDYEKASGLIKECITQLDLYFNRKLRKFTFAIAPSGTEFQLRVWKLLLEIPYGKTISYYGLAKQLGNVKSIRAAGMANGRNPLSIIIPCHRVIGSDGSLVGYAGGLWRKRWLLEHEQNNVNPTLF
jgi:methylated-DNA-[protein]-cysteine S-methyltransferase